MYCMRYFVPLLLLPFPDAPPIFVILFLISFFLHQKPCIYCTILLIALFTSTCYWDKEDVGLISTNLICLMLVKIQMQHLVKETVGELEDHFTHWTVTTTTMCVFL